MNERAPETIYLLPVLLSNFMLSMWVRQYLLYTAGADSHECSRAKAMGKHIGYIECNQNLDI